MELVHEFDYYGTLKPPVSFGNRCSSMAEGQVTQRLGRLLSVAETGSWSARTDGDRLTSGARSAPTTGPSSTRTTPACSLNDRVMTATASCDGTDWGDQYFRLRRVRTVDERYKWLTTSLFVSEGRIKEGGGVEYRVYRIT